MIKKFAGSIARLLFWLTLFLPTLLALWRSQGNGRSWQTLLWSAAICALPSILPVPLFVATQCLALLLMPALLWWITYAALNGVGPGWEAAMAALSTSPTEASGAVLLAIGTPHVVLFASLCSGCLLLSLVLMRQVRSHPELRDATGPQLKTCLAIALLPFFISAVTNAAKLPLPVLFLASDPGFSTMGTATRLLWEGANQLMYGDLMTLAPQRLPAHAPHQETQPKLAIFVIGESLRAGGIGPDKIQRGPWTKALDERMHHHLGAWLPTTCAGSNGTAVSVPLLLTALTPVHYQQAARAPSILAILKAAGYRTGWISNQDKGVFTEQGHDFYWTISQAAAVSDSYDEQLVPIARAFAAPIITGNNPQARPYAMILHMHGSHFEYVQRYPAAEFPAESTALAHDAQVELRYDRSAEYSAKVLTELAALLDQTNVPAYLVYSSDHGENLPSDHNGILLHLGPRATLRDGTTTSFVLWNAALARTGQPAEILKPLLTMPRLAHADIAKLFLALADMSQGPFIADTAPQIMARVTLNDSVPINACALLQP